ncbi:hypothetical protein [Endozoicomonas numazuensis]|uniref:Uncharacterized protein n=1 Tax=Endozoicomonas numazuensis TaxID=1137799 RepID=A0A081NER0_9GAMM|nr:hypothetical protein [Endozoicomonas numazuensis]KEQ16933.1 hypothetical protein GZ78_20065 [Endozoicomonas numazuensis]
MAKATRGKKDKVLEKGSRFGIPSMIVHLDQVEKVGVDGQEKWEKKYKEAEKKKQKEAESLRKKWLWSRVAWRIYETGDWDGFIMKLYLSPQKSLRLVSELESRFIIRWKDLTAIKPADEAVLADLEKNQITDVLINIPIGFQDATRRQVSEAL